MPESRDTQEICVTAEMIEAGRAVLFEHYPETAAGDQGDRDMVRDLFLAMILIGGRGRLLGVPRVGE